MHCMSRTTHHPGVLRGPNHPHVVGAISFDSQKPWNSHSGLPQQLRQPRHGRHFRQPVQKCALIADAPALSFLCRTNRTPCRWFGNPTNVRGGHRGHARPSGAPAALLFDEEPRSEVQLRPGPRQAKPRAKDFRSPAALRASCTDRTACQTFLVNLERLSSGTAPAVCG